jgi:hypothetical protein
MKTHLSPVGNNWCLAITSNASQHWLSHSQWIRLFAMTGAPRIPTIPSRYVSDLLQLFFVIIQIF